MDIELTGKTLSFPKLCCCCGTPTDATGMVGHTRLAHRRAHLTRWTVPCCERCSKHVQAAVWGGLVAVLLFLLALGSLGLLSPLLWLWYRHKQSQSRALCGPECGSHKGMTYEPFPAPGGGHRFRDVHREFARQVAIANRPALHAPSNAVLAMLS